MMDILQSQVSVQCPACRATLTVRLREFQRRRTVRCPQGHRIQLEEQGNELSKVDRATKELERSLRDLRF